MWGTTAVSRLALIVCGAGVVACSVLDPGDNERDRWNEARERWAAQRLVDYEYRFRRFGCECLPESMRTFIIRVANGVVVEVRDAETGEPASGPGDVATIAMLFDLVRNAIDREATVLEVEYHPSFGYPTSLSVDYERQVADDEFSIHADSLVPIR